MPPEPSPSPSLRLFLLIAAAAAIHLCSGASPSLRQQQPGAAVKLWCVAKNNAEDSALQSALDWACGAGGADCKSIQQDGPCYDPDDIRKTASFAFNDYCLKNGMTEDSCNFDNTAALTSLDPSHSNCKFPSSLDGKNVGSSQGTSIVAGQSSADTSKGFYVAFGLLELVWTLFIIHLFFLIM